MFLCYKIKHLDMQTQTFQNLLHEPSGLLDELPESADKCQLTIPPQPNHTWFQKLLTEDAAFPWSDRSHHYIYI